MPVDGATGCLGSFMRLKQQHAHLQLIVSIGGGGASENFAIVSSTAATRDNFGKSVRGLVDASGFDGIDSKSWFYLLVVGNTKTNGRLIVDWEHPSNPEQGRNFLALLAAVRLHLPDNRYLLTAALPAGRWVLQNIDLFKAQDYLDFINLMAYDFTGSWSERTGHHAQLFSSSSADEPNGNGKWSAYYFSPEGLG